MLKKYIQINPFFGNVPFDSAWVQALFKSLPNNIENTCRQQKKAYQKYKFGFIKEENSVGKGENAGYKIESTCIR